MESDKHNPAKKSRRLPKSGRLLPGQAMVEFVLVFPVFLLIVLGIFEFGWLLVNYTSVYAAAREGARYGAAVNNLCKTGIDDQARRVGFIAGDITIITQYQILNTYDKDNPGAYMKWRSGDCAEANVGDRVVVRVEKTYEPITGFIISSIPKITISSQASRTIVKDAYLSYTLPPPATSQPSTSTPPPGGHQTITPTEPTDSSTPTATNEPPPPGICNGIITWTANTNKASTATFTNNSGQNYVLTSIVVTWEKIDPLLNEVIYVNNDLYSPIGGLLMHSPATVPVPNWVVGTGNSTFAFQFSQNNARFTGVTLFMKDGAGNECRVQ